MPRFRNDIAGPTVVLEVVTIPQRNHATVLRLAVHDTFWVIGVDLVRLDVQRRIDGESLLDE